MISRRNFFAVFFTPYTVVALPPPTSSQREVMILSGTISASTLESSEGYFGVAQDVAVMVKPGSVSHDILKGLNGHKVDLIARIIP